MVFCDINLRMSLYPLLCNSTKYPQFIFMIFITCSYNVPVYLMIHICTFMYVYLNLCSKKNGNLFNNILVHLRICYRANFALKVLKDSQESIGLLNGLKTLNGFKAKSLRAYTLFYIFTDISVLTQNFRHDNFIHTFKVFQQRRTAIKIIYLTLQLSLQIFSKYFKRLSTIEPYKQLWLVV